MAAITSTSNARVKQLVLLKRRRARSETGTHLAEGPHAVRAALAAGLVRELFVTESGLALLGPSGEVPVTQVADAVIARLAESVTPQGVIALVSTPAYTTDVLADAKVATVVDQVSDPGNVGTIIRTAQALGADAVVLTDGCADPFSPKVIRASAGTVYQIPVLANASATSVISACRSAGMSIIALAADGSEGVSRLRTGSLPTALVLGSEAHGVSSELRQAADGFVSIRMPGGAESLNVAAAAAIALYEISQR